MAESVPVAAVATSLMPDSVMDPALSIDPSNNWMPLKLELSAIRSNDMSNYTAGELTEACRSIASTLHKCEKALLKLTPGNSRYTLTVRRIKAFQIALALIDRELEAEGNS